MCAIAVQAYLRGMLKPMTQYWDCGEITLTALMRDVEIETTFRLSALIKDYFLLPLEDFHQPADIEDLLRRPYKILRTLAELLEEKAKRLEKFNAI